MGLLETIAVRRVVDDMMRHYRPDAVWLSSARPTRHYVRDIEEHIDRAIMAAAVRSVSADDLAGDR